MMIAPYSRARKGEKERGEVKGEYGRIWGEEKGNSDYGGWCNPVSNMLHQCVEGVEWGLGTRGLRIVAAY